jgi:hypothetical protein
MTDGNWRTRSDPDAMLIAVEGVATDRQLRLWCCACVRRVWDRFAGADAGRRAELLRQALGAAGN